MNTVTIPARRYRFRVSRRTARMIAALEIPVSVLNAEREFWRKQAEYIDQRILEGLGLRKPDTTSNTPIRRHGRSK
jgi:hypothetical protein